MGGDLTAALHALHAALGPNADESVVRAIIALLAACGQVEAVNAVGRWVEDDGEGW